ncbi:hypothetical protein N752_13010 [Desulforamulus aquiferis]|nr:beta/gamma crystallin-related protein [Desulforamulus aquiferis]RYD04840.1 hypothetical protein N752_13010 [Desulforamulus aquiferis]
MHGVSISQIAIEGGQWLLYNNRDYSGSCAILSLKDSKPVIYSLSKDFAKDNIYSIRLLPEQGIVLFEKENYQGRIWETTKFSNFERNINVGARSCIIMSDEFLLYHEADFNGKAFKLAYTDEQNVLYQQ